MAEEEEKEYCRILQAEMQKKEAEMQALEDLRNEMGFTPRQSLARTPSNSFSIPSVREDILSPSSGKRPLASPQKLQDAVRRRTQDSRGPVPPISGILSAQPTPPPVPVGQLINTTPPMRTVSESAQCEPAGGVLSALGKVMS